MDNVDIKLHEEEKVANDPLPDVGDLSDDALIRYAQRQRKLLVEDIAKDGMPQKNTDRLAFLQALSDMTGTAHTNKRLDIDSASNEVNKQIFSIVDRLNQMHINGQVGEPVVRDVTPEPETLPEVNADDEVKKVGVTQESSDEFMSRMSKKDK